MKKVILLFVPLVFLISCKNLIKQDEFTVNGKVEGAAGRKIRLSELEVRRILPVDSVTADAEGKFSFTRPLKGKGFFILDVEDKRVILVPEAGEKITVSGKFSAPGESYEVDGSEDSEVLQDFLKRSYPNEKIADSLRRIIRENENTENMMAVSGKIDTVFALVIMKQREIQKKAIDKNPESLSTLLILNYTLGPTPVLDEEEDYEYYRKTDSILFKLYPENKHVEYHHMRADAIKNIIKMKKEFNSKKQDVQGQ